MIVQSADFEARYSVEELASPLSGGTFFEFFPKKASSLSGLTFETRGSEAWFSVKPQNFPTWVGRFAGGPGGLNGVFSTPSPNVVCIVVNGQGYWLDVDSPESFQTVRSLPIKNVFSVTSHELLVFVDYVRIAAYAPQGCVWVTEDLSWDGITVGDIDHNSLKGEAWDSPGDRYVPFSVDLNTGEVSGGSSPEKYGA